MLQDNAVGPRYFEDVEVGYETATEQIEVTRKLICDFAEVYDPQPMHLDEDAASFSVFGGLVASGWQTLAITMRLVVDSQVFGTTPIIGAELAQVRFHRPVRPSNSLKETIKVTGKRRIQNRTDRAFIELHVTTTNQDGETVVAQIWTLVIPTRPPNEIIEDIVGVPI